MIAKDSEITDVPYENFKNNTEEIFELIYTTSHSILYRIKKDGKYFIVKQNANLNELGRRILRREYEISIGLTHPNIIDIYEYRYSEDYDDRIIMEYVDGRSLIDFLSEAPGIKEKKRIFMELLDAIDYLHKNRIIHNDIKPENILITRIGNRVKLIDLGLSDDDANYILKSVGFTKGYAAPELINEGKSNIKSDIYSIGIIAKFLFGKRYNGIIKKCISYRPEKRFSDIKSLRRSFERVFLKWLIPLIVFIAIAVSMGISGIVETQKQKFSGLEDTISLQTQILNKQIKANQQLSRSYSRVKDSLNMIINDLSAHEELKNQRFADFQRKIRESSLRSLDSIKNSTDEYQIIQIKMNYQNKMQKLFDQESKIVDGEDIGPQLHSIMYAEMEQAFHEFSKHDLPDTTQQ